MTMIKSLILGSAAGLVALSGAQAADLPVKAKAVEYVRICSLYGAGFFYIPGTDTCIKLGGYLRVDTTFNGSPYDEPAWSGDQGQGNRYRDYFASRSRMALTVDTRTATEYGVVRTFGQLDWSFASPSGSVREVGFSGQAGGLNNGQQVTTEMLFIQFAGFTFGRSASAYATPWHGYPGNNSSFLVGGHDTVTGTNNIQYTAQFGNGVSGTIGLDDALAFNRGNVYNLATGGVSLGSAGAQTLSAIGTGQNAYAGVHSPDIVGNIRVDQAWGLFQISGALHEVNASYNNLTLGVANNLSEISGHPETKWGGSVMAALQIKNIPTGAGDDIKFDVSWSKGDIKNTNGTSSGVRPYAMFGGGGAGAYQSLGFGVATDGVYVPVSAGGDGSIHLTEGFGLRGAFNHNWDPYWSTSLFGGYSAVRYDGTAKAAFCASYVASNPGCEVCGFQLQSGLQHLAGWCRHPLDSRQEPDVLGRSPVDASRPEVHWLFGADAGDSQADRRLQYKDQDTVSLNIRAQRNF